VGDEAHFLGDILPLLEVLEGDWYFSISPSEDNLEGDDATRDAMVGPAQKVVDRLP